MRADALTAGGGTIDAVQKVVIVTGAGSGIGRATARVLLDGGHAVVLAGRRSESLSQTAEKRPNARVVPTDVTDATSVRALFADVESTFGRVDVLFNNAGVFGPSASIAEIDDERWHDTWRTNVDGAVFCAREAARIMAAQVPRGGRIINNGSLSAHRPRPNNLAYTVTKHAISGLTASMLLDLRGIDVCVTQIDIGNAATDMTAGFAHQTRQADGSLAARCLTSGVAERDRVALPQRTDPRRGRGLTPGLKAPEPGPVGLPALNSVNGASAIRILKLVALGHCNQFFANRRVGECVDPRVEAAPLGGALQICAKLREGHSSHSSSRAPGRRGLSCHWCLQVGDHPSYVTLRLSVLFSFDANFLGVSLATVQPISGCGRVRRHILIGPLENLQFLWLGAG